ncbi:dnaJ homolog subfamily C member 25 homolog [Lineus longissimus]|uniref:dnaJ homolog subfamily C member 25 homolog n=1 Tax=Lineus longissimus TaxID=88925 RepID=UPI002B4DF162
MAVQKLFSIFLLASLSISPSYAQVEGIYCGKENCYDVLGMTRDNSKSEIMKAYRKLARKWHPDRHKTEEAKNEAAAKFQTIANAYEILKDQDSRSEYDYMLDNPEEMYLHYYYYYRRRMAPKVDVRIVVAVTISIISVIQYYGAWNNYHSAISYLMTVPKYRMRAMEIAKEEGLLGNNKKKVGGKKISKEEQKEKDEATIRKIVENNMDIRGGYSKPSIVNILWFQMLFFPYYIVCYIAWWCRWVWKFWILKHEYGDEEKHYIIRKYMGLGQSQWEALDESDKLSFMKRELWLKEHFVEWKIEKDEEQKAKLAESSKYKSYRRYMKQGGPGQMTFGPE